MSFRNDKTSSLCLSGEHDTKRYRRTESHPKWKSGCCKEGKIIVFASWLEYSHLIKFVGQRQIFMKAFDLFLAIGWTWDTTSSLSPPPPLCFLFLFLFLLLLFLLILASSLFRSDLWTRNIDNITFLHLANYGRVLRRSPTGDTNGRDGQTRWTDESYAQALWTI